MIKVRAHVALTLASAMSALSLVHSTAFAQAAPAADTESATSGDALQEVVVTAEFRTEKLQEIPLAITAVNAETMEQRNMTNLIDIANVAPNVTMFENSAAYGKTNAAFIRGIGQGDFNLAAGEPGVGIYIDNVYFATTLGSAFDLYDLDSVEILRGPQGTLEGKNSIGGAINMHSKKPTGDNTGYVDVTLGDFSRRDIKAAYDMSVSDGLFLRVSAYEQYRAGYVTRANYACATNQPKADSGLTTDSRGYTINTFAPDYLGSDTPSQLGGSCAIGTEGGIECAVPAANCVGSSTTGWRITSPAMSWMTPPQRRRRHWSRSRRMRRISWDSTSTCSASTARSSTNRSLTKNFYTTYSNFYDLDLQESIPNTNSMHQWGFSDVYDWDIASQVHFKSITAFLGYWTDFSDDQSNSPLPLAWAYNLVDHEQFTQEFRFTGKAFERPAGLGIGAFYYRGDQRNRGQVNIVLLGGVPPPPFQNGPRGPIRLSTSNKTARPSTRTKRYSRRATEHVTDKLDSPRVSAAPTKTSPTRTRASSGESVLTAWITATSTGRSTPPTRSRPMYGLRLGVHRLPRRRLQPPTVRGKPDQRVPA